MGRDQVKIKTFIVKPSNFGLLTNLTNIVQLANNVLLAAHIVRKMDDVSKHKNIKGLN